MKTRTLLSIVCMFLCMQLWAQEFKVGDAKYLVRPDGKVELKEYKKAQGEVVLPSTVTNPQIRTAVRAGFGRQGGFQEERSDESRAPRIA